MQSLPFGGDTFDEVVGNRMPFMHGDFASRTAAAAYRVTAPGGAVRLSASNVGGEGWLSYLEQAGFRDVRLQGGYAVGAR